MTKPSKKLSLSKETLKTLTGASLSRVQGGVAVYGVQKDTKAAGCYKYIVQIPDAGTGTTYP